jgi:hypothetical protein
MAEIAVNSYSRVFLQPGQAGPSRAPAYQSCMKLAGVSQGFGDAEKIEAPDPARYGSFIQIGEVRGATERVKSGLSGRYFRNTASVLLQLAKQKCPVDVQCHFGECTDPSTFNKFEKAIVLEDVILPTWQTEDLGALASGDAGKIDESADLSAVDVYEILPLTFSAVAANLMINEIVDVEVCGVPSCPGACGSGSTGADHMYAVSKAGGGTAGTAADLLYTNDAGLNWYNSNIAAMAVSDEPSAVGCLGQYVFVLNPTSAAEAIVYIDATELDGTGDEAWTAVTDGFTSSKGGTCVSVATSLAWIGGLGGYIYKTADPSGGVTLVNGGAATAQDLAAIHAFSDTFVVAVGAAGAVVKTADGVNWTAITFPLNAALTSVFVVSENVWWIGTATGYLYYTENGGTSWAAKSFSGSGSGKVWDIKFSSRAVGYLSHQRTSPSNAGRILRTYDGGYSWVTMPEGLGSLPANDHIGALAVSKFDVNFVVGAGAATGGTNGKLLVAVD